MDKQMTLDDFGISTKTWEYDEDCGSIMCRCPDCGGRMSIGIYTYWNPYKYCPYCGMELAEGALVSKICAVYGHSPEAVTRVRQGRGAWRK
jgi:hypothetical protein